MGYFKHVLPLLFLCFCKMQTSNSKNVYIFEVEETRPCASAATAARINVTLTSSLHEIDARYLSIALASRRVGTNFLGSQKLINLGLALAPLELRLGGTSANFLTFISPGSTCQAEQEPTYDDADDDSHVDESRSPTDEAYYTVTGPQWESFNSFLKKAQWDLLFDVNNFKWTSGGAWDTTNFEQLLNYSSAKGIPIVHFQLGNEPNAYKGNFGVTISAQTLAANFKTMKSVISRYPLYASSKICGPDVANVARTGSAKTYLNDFLKAGAYEDIDEICLHHYYINGATGTVNDFVNAGIMDGLKVLYDVTSELTNATPKPRPAQLTETSSAYGGGADGLSNAYVAGFLWLDKLGLSARLKATRIYRQALIGGSYGLLTTKYDPNPDYYLSLVFKTLVDGPVFNTLLEVANDKLRVYANCASRKRYAPGALVVYYLNLADTDVALSLPQFQDADLDLYLLTPGDSKGLTSSLVKLNGNTLLLSGDQLPPLVAKPHKGDVTVEAKTFGFIVVPQANVPFCVNYFANLDSKSQEE